MGDPIHSMLRARLRSVALLVAIAAAASCTSLLGLEPVTFEGDPGTGGDASNDALGDASTTDAPSSIDAADATLEDGRVLTFCELRDAMLCEEFEGKLDDRLGPSNDANGTREIVDAGGLSRPRALVITTESVDALSTAALNYGTLFSPYPATHAALEVAIKFETKDDASELMFATLGLGQGAGGCSLRLRRGKADDYVVASSAGGSTNHSLSQRLPVGSWTRVRAVLERGGAGWRVSVSLDGQSVLDIPLACELGPDGGAYGNFSFGALVPGPAAPWKVWFDDVTMQLE